MQKHTKINASIKFDSPIQGSSTGNARGHFGELLQGIFCDRTGNLRRGLVTLYCDVRWSKVTLRVQEGQGLVHTPPDKLKAKAAIRQYLLHLPQRDEVNIYADFDSNIPVGVGMGSSTSDIVASIRALDAAFGVESQPHHIAIMAVTAETASDSTMFDSRNVLFAQRDAAVLEEFPEPLPAMTILGVDLMPDEKVSTLDMPPCNYALEEIKQFHRLHLKFSQGLRQQNAREIAEVSTQSAIINQRHYPKRGFQEFISISQNAGSLGVQISHSGTIAGIIFSSGDPNKNYKIGSAIRLLNRAGIKRLMSFEVGQSLTDAAIC